MTDLPTFPLTPEGVSEALGALDKGGSEDIAQRLAELGIRGQRDNDCACPVANYLIRSVPGLETAKVEGESAFVTGWELDGLGFALDLGPAHIDLPDSIAAFVEDFDQGIYPELIEKTREVSTDA